MREEEVHLIISEPNSRTPKATKATSYSSTFRSAWRAVVNSRTIRELLIVLTFFAMTAALTWPYVTRLRDAVVDPGDPYLISWILWWDYHATFTDPLNLFNANVFYPYRYTLAFSEHSYGIAMLFFPLFALGARPLTVHAVAIFCGFALCGYGAFRLARTLTGSYGVAWVSGIIFAFIPYRFGMMSQVAYLFSPWVPLLFEALVLFARKRSWKRALWLGCAFFLSGLTTISWLTLSLLPFALSAAVLLTRYGLWRDQAFWRRGAIALGVAAVALLPFMLPYYWVLKMYGFTRRIEDVKSESAWPIHWLSVEVRNRFWSGFGSNVNEGWKFKLFPGLVPLLLSLAALVMIEPAQAGAPVDKASQSKRLLFWLDALIVLSLAIAIMAIGFEGLNFFHGLFDHVTSERALSLLLVAILTRLCLAYPSFLRRGDNANLIETLRSPRRTEAFWLGLVWVIVGFCYSLGWNFFVYRILYDLVPLFKGMRVVTRGAMIAYLGIALLAGLGAKRLSERIVIKVPRVRPAAVYLALCVLLLFELNAAPLRFMRGDVYPDAVTLRLKQTPMSGGIVVLPAGADFNHHHILRAADHAKPLIVGTSGFITPYEYEIETLTRSGTITPQFMDLLEKIPTSYLVIANHNIAPERRVDYEAFLMAAVTAGRLRYINRFDDRDDLYALVKIEPQTKSEAPLPFKLEINEWDKLIKEDPVNILGQHRSWSQALYRIYVASYGQMPRYAEFLKDVELIGRQVPVGFQDDHSKVENNLKSFAESWAERPTFRALYKDLSGEGYVDRLISNAGINLQPAERVLIIDKLNKSELTRAGVLLEIVNNPAFITKEEVRSVVLLHYFGYLRRNPNDPPDKNLNGFNFWVGELERSGEIGRLPRAFMASGEYDGVKKK